MARPTQTDDDSAFRKVMQQVLASEADTLGRLANALPNGCVPAVRLLADCRGRVIVTGLGKMSTIARKFSAMLCSTGTPATFLHPAEAHHGDLGMVTSADVLVALSNSGETDEVNRLLPFMKRHDVPVIAITGRTPNALASNADCVVDLAIENEADSLTDAPTNSTTATLAVCDALAICLVHLRGFTREQFALFHPAGQLGRKLLLTVGDLMHTGDRIPRVTSACTLREAVMAISQKGLGAGLICDNDGTLLGIITDGDLRRILQKSDNPLSEPVTSLMSADPIVARPEALAVEALNQMRERSVTVLPVVSDNRIVVGVIHLHDLLRAGLG